MSDLFELTWRTLAARRLKTLLMALGPLGAVAVVVGSFGVLRTSRADLIQEVDRLGGRVLQVRSVTDETRAPRLPDGLEDWVGRVGHIDSVEPVWFPDPSVSPVRWLGPTGREVSSAGVIGTTAGFFDHLGLERRSGRVFSGAQADVAAQVAVLGFEAGESWRTAGSPSEIEIGSRPFLVIGTLARSEVFERLNLSVFVPVDASVALGDPGAPQALYVTVDRADRSEAVAQTIEELGSLEEPSRPVRVDVAADAVRAQLAINENSRLLTYAVGLLVAVMGSIATANVLSIGVLERRAEIGLRRAMGQPLWAIGGQVVGEAVGIGLVGSVLGLGLGLIITMGFGVWQGSAAIIDWTQSLAVLLVAVVLTGVAGILPARRAMVTAPVDALRSI